MDRNNSEQFFTEAVDITLENIHNGGRPFGAVIVKEGKVVARAVNSMLDDCDPTAHAEMSAIRKAAKALKSIDLTGAIVYATGEPCPMCQAAIYMAGIREVYYLLGNEEGAPYNLSIAHIAFEMRKLPQQRTHFTFQKVDEATRKNYPDLYALWDQRQRAH